jgi:hypothetical protein
MLGGAAERPSISIPRRRGVQRYLASTDPAEIELLYVDATRFDTLSRASLTTGEILIATGLYFRFVRRPAASRTAVIVSGTRCAIAVNF